MNCQNCGKREANIKYTQVINGVKKEMALCEDCAKKLGIEGMDFSIPIDFSSFLGDFFDESIQAKGLLNSFGINNTLMCKGCGLTYDDFLNTGKFGCSKCYDTFGVKIDNLLKNIHGSDEYKGRKLLAQKSNIKSKIETPKVKKQESKEEKITELKKKLQLLIKEEKYEEAAKIRDEIKKLEK